MTEKDMNVSTELRRLIADDGYAISFQTMGQYRTALLRVIDAHAAAWNARPAPEALGAAGVSEADLVALLPGTYYMDPPDGGSVTLLEQLQRMAKDAARFRWLNSQRSEVWHEFADVPTNRTCELIDIEIAKEQA